MDGEVGDTGSCSFRINCSLEGEEVTEKQFFYTEHACITFPLAERTVQGGGDCKAVHCGLEVCESHALLREISLILTSIIISVLGALSIIGSAVYRKTLCNPKVGSA